MVYEKVPFSKPSPMGHKNDVTYKMESGFDTTAKIFLLSTIVIQFENPFVKRLEKICQNKNSELLLLDFLSREI
jgi:hypothetical protein